MDQKKGKVTLFEALLRCSVWLKTRALLLTAVAAARVEVDCFEIAEA